MIQSKVTVSPTRFAEHKVLQLTSCNHCTAFVPSWLFSPSRYTLSQISHQQQPSQTLHKAWIRDPRTNKISQQLQIYFQKKKSESTSVMYIEFCWNGTLSRNQTDRGV